VENAEPIYGSSVSTPYSPLCSPWQVAGAAFLGGPAAGLWLIASNFEIIGWRDKARHTRMVMVAVLVAMLAFVVYGPNMKGTGGVFAGALAGFVRQYALSSYGATYKRHLDDGGLRASHWRWIGVGLVGLMVTVSAIVGYVYGLGAVAPQVLPARWLEGG
jgi:hypothetical protein